MRDVNLSSRAVGVALAACSATLAVTLTGCSHDSDHAAPATSSLSVNPVSTEEATPETGCPMAAPTGTGTPEWTFAGTTGKVAVTGSTDTTSPLVEITAPFAVNETQVHTLRAGDGPVVPNDATVSVCYVGVNGRDGKVFDSAYERGEPAEFPLTGVVPGFQKAIAAQHVGSTVAVAMTSADGYPNGQPQAGIKPGDTLVFAIKILAITG